MQDITRQIVSYLQLNIMIKRIGTWIPNLRHLKLSNNLAKIDNLAKYFYNSREHIVGHLKYKSLHHNSSHS